MTEMYFFHLICLKRLIWFLVCRTLIVYFWINIIKVKGGPIIHMLGYFPTKTQELLGNPDKAANPTASSPACAGLAGEHCNFNLEFLSWNFIGDLNAWGNDKCAFCMGKLQRTCKKGLWNVTSHFKCIRSIYVRSSLPVFAMTYE